MRGDEEDLDYSRDVVQLVEELSMWGLLGQLTDRGVETLADLREFRRLCREAEVDFSLLPMGRLGGADPLTVRKAVQRAHMGPLYPDAATEMGEDAVQEWLEVMVELAVEEAGEGASLTELRAITWAEAPAADRLLKDLAAGVDPRTALRTVSRCMVSDLVARGMGAAEFRRVVLEQLGRGVPLAEVRV